MLTQQERQEIRAEVYDEPAEIEHEIAEHAGSTGICVLPGGLTSSAHQPVGHVRCEGRTIATSDWGWLTCA